MAEATHTDTSADRASTGPTRAPKIADVPQAAPLEMSPGRSFAPRSGLARALAKADAKRRAEVVLELQQTHGNAFVQRLLEGSDAHIGNGRQAPAFPVVPGHAALNAGQVKWGRHADFPGTMGQTYYAHNDIEIWPSFRAVTERSIWPWGWQANIAKTDAAGGVWVSPVWGNFMHALYYGEQPEFTKPAPWPIPNGITYRVVDDKTGLLASSFCPPTQAYTEMFIAGTEPTELCRNADEGLFRGRLHGRVRTDTLPTDSLAPRRRRILH